jgi:hypothetical protein
VTSVSSTSSSTTTSTATPSSLPIKGIIAGSVVGAVAVAAIVAIAWFLIQTRHSRSPSPPANILPQSNYEVKPENPIGVEHNTYALQDSEPSKALRYPEAIDSDPEPVVSGNLRTEFVS